MLRRWRNFSVTQLKGECTRCGTSFGPREEFRIHGYRVQEESVQNVGHHSNQRRSSGNMVTEFMYVQNVGLYSNQRRGSGCMETEFMMMKI